MVLWSFTTTISTPSLLLGSSIWNNRQWGQGKQIYVHLLWIGSWSLIVWLTIYWFSDTDDTVILPCRQGSQKSYLGLHTPYVVNFRWLLGVGIHILIFEVPLWYSDSTQDSFSGCWYLQESGFKGRMSWPLYFLEILSCIIPCMYLFSTCIRVGNMHEAQLFYRWLVKRENPISSPSMAG